MTIHDCNFSTDIAGFLTAGTGHLDDMGNWEVPCDDCRLTMELKLGYIRLVHKQRARKLRRRHENVRWSAFFDCFVWRVIPEWNH